MNEWQLRVGQRDDCHVLARMINAASEGAVEYLFGGLNANQSPLELLAEQLSTEVHYSYANSLVASQDNGSLVAMVLSFPASGLALEDAALNIYSDSQQQYLKFFSVNRINDSWHLDSIYVEEGLRGMGLGGRLLNDVKETARYYKFPAVQVFVFGTNEQALKFYQRNGFVIDKEISVDSHEFLSNKKTLVRMRCLL